MGWKAFRGHVREKGGGCTAPRDPGEGKGAGRAVGAEDAEREHGHPTAAVGLGLSLPEVSRALREGSIWAHIFTWGSETSGAGAPLPRGAGGERVNAPTPSPSLPFPLSLCRV